jgi:hypothetical protein
MPEQQTSNQNPEGNSGTQGGSTGYSREYVHELREEAAGYRTRLKEAENKINELAQKSQQDQTKTTLQSILEKKNVKVNPDWIKIENGQNPEQAVDNFLKEYPQFASSTQNSTQKPLSPERKNTNVPTSFSPDYKAEKSDPISRSKIREQYRNMLRGSQLAI